MKVTVLITTYNWPEALQLVLKSVIKQSKPPEEIVIADDGSTHETAAVITEFKSVFSGNVKHIWHEDKGFTKTIILNKALQEVTSPYIIQIDGDVILHRHFVKDHIRYSQENTYLFGSRVSMNENRSKEVVEKETVRISWLSKGLLRRTRAVYIPFLNRFRKTATHNSSKLRGCNISYWKKDAYTINGYNEDFIGWGYEDYDFAQRLLHAGVVSKRIKYAAIQFHIYHKEATKGNTTQGDKIQIETQTKRLVQCKNGIVKL